MSSVSPLLGFLQLVASVWASSIVSRRGVPDAELRCAAVGCRGERSRFRDQGAAQVPDVADVARVARRCSISGRSSAATSASSANSSAARFSSRTSSPISIATSGKGSSRRCRTFFKKRFPQADGTVDGILCWDVIDYLDRASAQALADAADAGAAAGRRAARLLRHRARRATPATRSTSSSTK